MKFRKIFYILIICILNYSCTYNVVQEEKIIKVKNTYSSSGFALIYNNELYKKKIISTRLSNNGYFVIHPVIKKNTFLLIFNPENKKSIKAKVIKNTNLPNIYKLLINEKISNDLSLNKNNPFIEFTEIIVNKTFIAKQAKMFEEEKKVSMNVPVKSIEVTSISKNNDLDVEIKKNKLFNIIISDFHYKTSAQDLIKRLKIDGNIDKLSIKRLNNNKFRLSCGPFENFNSLKDSYSSLNKLGFEDLDIDIIIK